jgi:hypothetical protein
MPHEHHDAAHLAALGREWIAAWNSRDLEQVLTLYADDCEMTSDKIQALGFDSSGTLRGKGQASDVLGESPSATCAQPAF